MRQVEFRAYVTQAELKRLRQRKPSAGWVGGAVAIALAWIFSAFGMSPERLDFGTLKLGSSGRLPVELTNRGLTELRPASVTVEGADARDFALDSGQSCAMLKAGESCVLWVDFRPQGSGEKHAKLIVRSDDGNELSSEFTGKATGKDIPPPIHPNPVHTDNSIGETKQVKHEDPRRSDPPNWAPSPDTSPTIEHNIPRSSPNSNPTRNPPGAPTNPINAGLPAVAPDLTSPRANPISTTSIPTPTSSPPPQGPTPTRATQPHAHITMTPGVAEFQAASPNAKLFIPPTRPITVTSDGTGDVRQLNLKIGTPGGAFSYRPGCPIYLARGQSCTVQVQFVSRDTQSHLDSLSAFDGGVHLATVSLRAAGAVSTTPTGQAHATPHVTMTPSELKFWRANPLRGGLHPATTHGRGEERWSCRLARVHFADESVRRAISIFKLLSGHSAARAVLHGASGLRLNQGTGISGDARCLRRRIYAGRRSAFRRGQQSCSDQAS